ncbi:PREDICTED: D-inositol 3-phosphate glycosyltransferase-like [Acropora digitifera]|uniref:D-inositol 3-phosphate glycosyltransferase-like n=1 Tax=Acropora digitifera TaxID=70779 RepID=UPI00077A408B|nr:PREDICTED: D-inositol 3-phosphate glycosyltransferase-like [Acropora digitifera]
MYQVGTDAAVKLCKEADHVVAIGPKLADIYSRSCGERKVFDFTPGIFSEFANIKQGVHEREVFHVLVFGRGDIEDFRLKGYDIAARAVALLNDEKDSFKLVFVGAPTGKEERKRVEEMLLEQGILPHHLIVRSAMERNQLADQFYEADLVIMPSRTEGFGLTALEALSAGLPVRVSTNSGLGRALQELPYGENVVLNSEDPAEWAKEIKAIRRKSRKLRLDEATELREKYAKKYRWEEQCRGLVQLMYEIVKC